GMSHAPWKAVESNGPCCDRPRFGVRTVARRKWQPYRFSELETGRSALRFVSIQKRNRCDKSDGHQEEQCETDTRIGNFSDFEIQLQRRAAIDLKTAGEGQHASGFRHRHVD